MGRGVRSTSAAVAPNAVRALLDGRRRPDGLPLLLERDDRLLDFMSTGELSRRLRAYAEFLAREHTPARAADADTALGRTPVAVGDLPVAELDACLALLADDALPVALGREIHAQLASRAHTAIAVRCQELCDQLGLTPPTDGPVWTFDTQHRRAVHHAADPSGRVLCGRAAGSANRRELNRERAPETRCKLCAAAIIKGQPHRRHPLVSHRERELSRQQRTLRSLTTSDAPRHWTDVAAAVDAVAWASVYWCVLIPRWDNPLTSKGEIERVTGVRVERAQRWRLDMALSQAGTELYGRSYASAADRIAAWNDALARAYAASA